MIVDPYGATSEKEVTAEIRAELARQKKTVVNLAQQTGMSRDALSSKVHDRVAFKFAEISKVASVLGLSASELIARAEQTRAGQTPPAPPTSEVA